MKRFLLGFVFVAGLCLNVDAANPSFSSFATNQFITNNFLIRVRLNPAQFDTNASSVTITLTNVAGVPGGGTLWTNSSGVLQPLGHIGGTNQFTIAEASGWTGTGTNAFFDDGTFSGVATINATDGFMPYRVGAYTLEDSPWRVDGTNMVSLMGGMFVGPNASNYFASPLSGNQIVAINDAGAGDVDFFNGLFESVNGADDGYAQFVGDSNSSEMDLYAKVSGVQNRFVATEKGLYQRTGTSEYHVRIQPFGVSPPFYFDFATNNAINLTNTLWELRYHTNLQFAVLVDSGFTGGGTKALTDDGTYKTFASTSGTTINPTDNYIPFRTNSTTFLNSPFYVVSTNAAIDSQLIFGTGTTNVLYRSGTDLIYTNGSATPNLTVVKGDGTKVSMRMTTGSHGMVVAGAGSDLYLSSNNNGSGDYVANSGGFLPTSSGSRSLGSSSMGFKDLYIAGTTNQIHFGATNTAPVSSAAPTKWISVQVSGESTVYRMPLYE